jgi:hypothetical protein
MRGFLGHHKFLVRFQGKWAVKKRLSYFLLKFGTPDGGVEVTANRI